MISPAVYYRITIQNGRPQLYPKLELKVKLCCNRSIIVLYRMTTISAIKSVFGPFHSLIILRPSLPTIGSYSDQFLPTNTKIIEIIGRLQLYPRLELKVKLCFSRSTMEIYRMNAKSAISSNYGLLFWPVFARFHFHNIFWLSPPLVDFIYLDYRRSQKCISKPFRRRPKWEKIEICKKNAQTR